jgi:hypothetical protein
MSKINDNEIKKRFEKISRFETNPEIVKHDLDRTKQDLIKLTQNQNASRNIIWKIIMKNKITKTAASIIFGTLLVSITYGTANVVKTVISGNSQISEVLSDLPFSIPEQVDNVTIEAIKARGEVLVAQLPKKDNSYEMIITFDDGPLGGPDWYDVIVNVISGQPATKLSIHVKAYIDGTSDLVFQNNSVYWHNLTWERPGKHDGNNFPTYINGIEWIPLWPAQEVVNEVIDTNEENIGEMISDTLMNLPFSIPKEPFDVNIETIAARGNVTVLQSLAEDNHHELTVKFDDGSLAGPEWYDVTVNINPAKGSMAKKISIHIKAYIDGVSNLVFCDNYAYWLNLEWNVPGKHGGNNFPTYINNIEWIPKWEKIKQIIKNVNIPKNIISENVEKQTSDIFTLPFTLPKEPADVKIKTNEARGEVSISQLPQKDNDYVLIATFNDDLLGGASWYDVVINVTTIKNATNLSIHVKAYIDGISSLIFKDNTVQWSHLEWEKPGLHDGNNFPTYINDIEWIPQWPQTDK